MPARTMGKGINRTLGKWKKRRKIKYLVLCNCALLAVFLVLLGTAFLSGKFSQQTQGQKEEAVSQSAQHIPQPLDFGEAGPAAPDPGITQPEQEDPGSLNSEDAIQGAGQPEHAGPDSLNPEDAVQGAAQPEKDGSYSPEGSGSQQAASDQGNSEVLLQKKIQDKINSMTLEEKVSQLFIITPEALTGRPSVTQAGEATRNAISQYPVGGLIFFGGNIQSQQQVTEMLGRQQEYSQARIGLPLFLSVDEEGGQVTRLASAPGIQVETFPDIAELGATQDVNQAYQLGDALGEYLSAMGFNLDFAPVADVLTNPSNTVVKRRSYGSSPQLVSEMVRNNLEGLQNHQVFGCIKHFPGHGATVGDTHEGYAYTDKSWEELKSSDLIPFQDSIAWGVEFVMVGHISLPQITGDGTPASLSPYAIGDLLRGELGYEGIVLTDALNMKAVTSQYTSSQAAVAAIQAGNDMILMPEDFPSAYQGILDAVKSGVITQERLEESLRRILERKFSGTFDDAINR